MRILIRPKQSIIKKILYNGSCREQSNTVLNCPLGLICHDCHICDCTWVHLLSSTPQYQFRYHRSNYHWNGSIDFNSLDSLPFRKEDLSIGTSTVSRKNITVTLNLDNRVYLPLILTLACFVAFLTGCGPTTNTSLLGTALRNHNGSTFSLEDENRLEISNQTHVGKVHLVTFLFTNCSSLCPIVTSSIKQAIDKSEYTKNIPILIISVDPEGDTAESRLEFKDRWELRPNWSYLNGTREELQTIWLDFYVNPQESALEKLAGQTRRKYDVIHTSPVFIVGKDGRPAAVHTNPIEPSHLYKDILTISGR